MAKIDFKKAVEELKNSPAERAAREKTRALFMEVISQLSKNAKSSVASINQRDTIVRQTLIDHQLKGGDMEENACSGDRRGQE